MAGAPGRSMIVRVWRGRAAADKPDDYPAHFRGKVLAELRALEGFLGATLLRRDDADGIEFVVQTRWTSMDAIRGFAREPERAVVEPGAVAALTDFDQTVTHYEVVEDDGPDVRQTY